MCGLIGIYNYSKSQDVDEKLLIKMRDTMLHRGPDDTGIYVSPDKNLGLGHTRLSIIDLSKAGHQPMSDEGGRFWIVYNGEVYNFQELRELYLKDVNFISRTDTEVLIYLYKKFKEKMLEKLRGMFAFAIWDDKEKELFLARDRIGIKPLYYTFVNGTFIFASEIKAILEYPEVKRQVNEEAFYHYLSFLTTPPPLTLFEGIYKLPAGHFLKLDRNGRFSVKQYWNVFEKITPFKSRDEGFYTEKILSLLDESVRLRMIADVPVGVFLSGGIDSSTNVALFSKHTDKVKTFSIGFKNAPKFNEFKYARMVAQKFKTQHYETIINEDDLIEFLDTLVYHQDEPIADPVCVPVYFLSKLAKENGVTVCQVGEGSDELFCGYPVWGILLKLQHLSRYWRIVPSFIRKFGLKTLEIAGKGKSMYYELLRRGHTNESIFWGGAEAYTPQQKNLFLSDGLKKKIGRMNSYEVVEKYYKEFLERSPIKDYLTFMTYLDLSFRLPELLLMRVDKMSMIVSLECRVPFLDHKFVEFAMSIPEEIKIKKGILKYILKKAVKGVIPDEVIYRKKQGFGVPVRNWFHKKLGKVMKNKLVKFAEKSELFNPVLIKKMVNTTERGDSLWFLFNFILWHEKWIE